MVQFCEIFGFISQSCQFWVKISKKSQFKVNILFFKSKF